jgi:uncharacterized protein (TIGR03083 family)
MITNIIDVSTRSPLSRQEAMRLQAAELDRTLELLRTLDDEAWATQTECPDWDVHHMYLHVLGACEAGASMRENIHQMQAAMRQRRREGGPLEAALSSVQVRDRSALSPAELIDRLTAIAPVTIRKRSKMPSLMRRMPMKIDGPVTETWKLGYLNDTIYLRDLWMHRIDASTAIGQPPVLTAEHDGHIVADVVAEWARRHAQPCTLRLRGPAGGTYSTGGGGENPGEELDLDAVEFCRALAGRVEATGLLTTIVPF